MTTATPFRSGETVKLGEHACQPGAARCADVVAGRTGEVVGTDHVGLERATTGVPPLCCIAANTPASHRSRRRGCRPRWTVGSIPHRHQLAPPATQPIGFVELARARSGTLRSGTLRSGPLRPGPDRSVPGPHARADRRTPLGLDGVEAGTRGRVGETGTEAHGECTTAHLHEDPIQRPTGLFADLPPDRAAAVERQCVLRSLHGEGDGRPPATAFRKRSMAGSPRWGRPTRRSQRCTVAPRRSSSVPKPAVIQVGT